MDMVPELSMCLRRGPSYQYLAVKGVFKCTLSYSHTRLGLQTWYKPVVSLRDTLAIVNANHAMSSRSQKSTTLYYTNGPTTSLRNDLCQLFTAFLRPAKSTL